MDSKTDNQIYHIPVLLKQTIDLLNVPPGGIIADVTCGGGGHSEEILLQNPDIRLLCFDQDPEAIAAASVRLAQYSERVTFINENFLHFSRELNRLGISKVEGILADLGVSSHQLDDGERGFSFHQDAPLDMRMSGKGASAADLINNEEPGELERILFTYGEEKYARGIVKGIVAARERSPIATTGELAEIIRTHVPLSVRNAKNPCRKTFQALRIAVNGELDALNILLKDGFEALAPGGRFAVITFHSLEDRIVKTAFKDYATGCICPPELPVCVCGRKPRGAQVTRKPVTAGEDELQQNPRARSAKLRVIEKV
jgi:16S rRNA (cytosine1402-N4)-methyltransferase